MQFMHSSNLDHIHFQAFSWIYFLKEGKNNSLTQHMRCHSFFVFDSVRGYMCFGL